MNVASSSMNPLEGRRVLVTAGPTWVAVDRVRVITTVFTGETGLAIARHFRSLGAEVDLWMGPGRARLTAQDRSELSVTDFRYYDDLASLVHKQEVSRYDVIVHSAAVADYKPIAAEGKIGSGLDELTITLKPTEKLVDVLRRRAPGSVLVKFKLEVGLTEAELLEIAAKSRSHSEAEFIVANVYEGMSATKHEAHILDETGHVVPVQNKNQLCTRLGQCVARRLMLNQPSYFSHS